MGKQTKTHRSRQARSPAGEGARCFVDVRTPPRRRQQLLKAYNFITGEPSLTLIRLS